MIGGISKRLPDLPLQQYINNVLVTFFMKRQPLYWYINRQRHGHRPGKSGLGVGSWAGWPSKQTPSSKVQCFLNWSGSSNLQVMRMLHMVHLKSPGSYASVSLLGDTGHCPQCTHITGKWQGHISDALTSLPGNVRHAEVYANSTQKA